VLTNISDGIPYPLQYTLNANLVNRQHCWQWHNQTSVLGGAQPVASPGVRGWGGKVKGLWGTEVPQWGPGAEPRWASGGEAHDINFVLRITLVNVYCPFYSSYIITYVIIGFSRSSHISHFQSLPYLPPSMCSQFWSDLRESQDRV